MLPTPQLDVFPTPVVHVALDARHIDELRASTITPETAAAAGIYSAEGETVNAILGWKPRDFSWGRCMVFVYPPVALVSPAAPIAGPPSPFTSAADPTGFYRATTVPAIYARVKADDPRPMKSLKTGITKLVKYEAPSKRSNRAYIIVALMPAMILSDTTRQLIITEGEKKTLSLLQAGFPTIGLSGVWAWERGRPRDVDGKGVGRRELIDDLEAIAWKGRPVVIMFDSDAATNKQIQKAETALAGILRRAGATVRIAHLPAGQARAKVGADDFLAAIPDPAARPIALQAILDAAAQPGAARQGFADIPPLQAAQLYIADQRSHSSNVPTLAWYDDEFWEWQSSENCWAKTSDKTLRARVLGWCGQRDPDVRPRYVRDVFEYMQSILMLPNRTEQPSWLNGAKRNHPPATEIIAARNCLIHPPAVLAAELQGGAIEKTPAFFSLNALAYDFRPDAPEPVAWLTFLNEIWERDPESIDTLQEWFGYTLTPDTRQQKALFMFGPQASGKGTIMHVMEQMVGEHNSHSTGMASLSSQFGSEPLKGKLLCVVPDPKIGGKTDVGAFMERLLSITGEDRITIDAKHVGQVAKRVYARLAIGFDQHMELHAAGSAIVRRALALKLVKTFRNNPDNTLRSKFVLELPGILLWALRGWQRLYARGRFLQPTSGKEIIDDLRDIVSPLDAFVDERCVTGMTEAALLADLYRAYVEWCKDRGIKWMSAQQRFGRELQSVLRLRVPEFTAEQQRVAEHGGAKLKVYVGISLAGSADHGEMWRGQ